MALPSGTFNRSYSCPIQISFSGEFSMSSDLWSPGSNSLFLVGSVTDGTTTRTVSLSMATPSGLVDWDYVAGSVLTCAIFEAHHSVSTTGSVSAHKLRIRAIVMKR